MDWSPSWLAISMTMSSALTARADRAARPAMDSTLSEFDSISSSLRRADWLTRVIERLQHLARQNAKIEGAEYGQHQRRQQRTRDARFDETRRRFGKEHRDHDAQIIVPRDGAVDDADNYYPVQQRIVGHGACGPRRLEDQQLRHEACG